MSSNNFGRAGGYEQVAHTYVLTLNAGKINFVEGAVRGQMFEGSETTANWSPMNPKMRGGFKDGDILRVVATFNLSPENLEKEGKPWPPASNYVGLSVGACLDSDEGRIQELLGKARALPYEHNGHLLGGILPDESDPEFHEGPYQDHHGDDPNNYIFLHAKGTRFGAPVPLEKNQYNEHDRGELPGSLVYKWEMIFNGHNNIDPTGKEVELIFGYGDPMWHKEVA